MSARANPGRVAAVRALVAIEEGDHAEQVLSDALPEGNDGRLAWHICFGVLRHRSQVDASLRPFLKQPLSELDAPVRAVLRAGAFEKIFSRAPDHAVVSQGVEVASAVGARRAKGLINAILRRVKLNPKMYRAERLDHPSWLLARWDQRYGKEATKAWCDLSRTVPPVCLVTRDLKALDELIEEPVSARLGERELPNTRIVSAGPHLPGIEERLTWVQDPAAVQVADLVAKYMMSGRVLDVCAAPGGKSLRLWSHGLKVTATDLPKRLPRLSSNIERLDADIAVVGHDWSSPHPELTGFDAVLLDAPCTGLGTLRRHPEIRWRRKPADLKLMAQLQTKLIHNAMKALKPGGVFVYAVCSPAPEEGEAIAQLAIDAGYELLERFDSSPPQGDEDAHQAFVLRSPNA